MSSDRYGGEDPRALDSPSGHSFVSYGWSFECPAREMWEAWWAKVALPLAGRDLADGQATIAAYADPDEPQGDEGDCGHCVAQVERLIAEVERAEAGP